MKVVKCTTCGAIFENEEVKFNQKVECPECGISFMVGEDDIYEVENPSMQAEEERSVKLPLWLMLSVASIFTALLTVVLFLCHQVKIMNKMSAQLIVVNEQLVKLIDNPIESIDVMNYSWGGDNEMEQAVNYAGMLKDIAERINDGYTPYGYLCQNGIRGGMFLFVKHKYSDSSTSSLATQLLLFKDTYEKVKAASRRRF